MVFPTVWEYETLESEPLFIVSSGVMTIGGQLAGAVRDNGLKGSEAEPNASGLNQVREPAEIWQMKP